MYLKLVAVPDTLLLWKKCYSESNYKSNFPSYTNQKIHRKTPMQHIFKYRFYDTLNGVKRENTVQMSDTDIFCTFAASSKLANKLCFAEQTSMNQAKMLIRFCTTFLTGVHVMLCCYWKICKSIQSL